MRAERKQFIGGFLISILIILTVYGMVTIPDEPTQAAENAARVLCVGIIANTANVARDDKIVVDLCREVGIDRADYPDTNLP